MIANLVTRFAADDGPAIHVAPDAVFQLGGLTITNSILYGWICTVALVALLIWVARQVTVKPKGGLVQFIEVGADFITKTVVDSFEDKSKGRKYVPFFMTIFFFLVITNWLGLVPGVGEALRVGETPVLRAFTADLNGTLAIGAFTMLFVYAASVRESGGFKKYLRHFFIGSPWNPLYFFIGLLEMLTDLTRVLSLSLRLFLNVTIGEIIIAVFSYLGQLVTPVLSPVAALPFTLIELFVGALQAYIFTVLAVMYLSMAANHSHGSEHADADTEADDDHDGLTAKRRTETMKLRSGEA